MGSIFFVFQVFMQISVSTFAQVLMKFYEHQQAHNYSAHTKTYIHFQAELLAKYKDQNVMLAGDGRCDSPGSSARFCTYSVIELKF